jgi:RsiW-degrading membrane proteinase PrsW (M82 family)
VNATKRPVVRRWGQIGAMLVGFGTCALVMAAAVGASVGVQAALLGLVLAVLPLGVVVPAFLWLDRFEAEPKRMLLFAFAWGALVAAAGALVINTTSILVLDEVVGDGLDGLDGLTVGAVVVAPIVEESLKGFAVLIIAIWRRRHFDGIVDGMVYAGISAAGFAFAENIVYLSRAFSEDGGQGLAAVFFMRAVMGPFAHPLFTICTGIGLGIAVNTRRPGVRIAAPLVGLLLAMMLHATWNLSAVAGVRGFFTLYVFLQVPIFAGSIALATWARRREGRLIGQQLSLYAAAGWLSFPEVRMLSSMPDRRRARVWAKFNGGRPALHAMEAFQDAASELAYLRMRAQRGAADDTAAATERTLLDSLMTRRREFIGSPAT